MKGRKVQFTQREILSGEGVFQGLFRGSARLVLTAKVAFDTYPDTYPSQKRDFLKPASLV
jgi:hypothetical protein